MADLQLRPLLLELGQIQAVLRLDDPQVLEAYAGPGQPQILAGLEQRDVLGVSALEHRQERRLDLLGQSDDLLRTLDERLVAVRRRPQCGRPGQNELAACTDGRQAAGRVGRRGVWLEVALETGDVASVAELVQ